MNFLSNQRILEQVRSLVGEDGDVRAAVAFWGSNAVDQTGIAHKRNGRVRVLCDLFSGSCNPYEIETLLNCSNAKVRTLYGMHAKVWANGDHVIVGSANASMNGLGFETDGSNVEAAVELRSRAKAKQVRAWFKENWNSKATLEVDQQVLAEAKDVWDKRQKNNAPRQIMNYHIGAYPSEKLDREVIGWCRENLSNVEEYQVSEEYPVYVYPPGAAVPQPGTVILEFTWQNGGENFTFNGTFQIDGEPDLLDDGRQVVVVSQVNDPTFPIDRHRRAPQMVMCSVEGNHWEQDNVGWYVYKKFADFFHGTRARCHNREDRCDDCPFPLEREV